MANPEQRAATKAAALACQSRGYFSCATFFSAADWASLNAASTDCLPVHTASNALATGSHRADMKGVLGSGTPFLTWAPNPAMSVMAWTLGSARASLLAGISLVVWTIEVWFSLLVKNFMMSAASAGLVE